MKRLSLLILFFNVTNCYGNTVWTDGFLGVAMNVLSNILCNYNQNSTIDLGQNLTLHWYNTNSGIHKSYLLEEASSTMLNEDSFDATVPWIFFIGGFGTNVNTDSTASLIDSLTTVQDKYVIYLDHSNLTYSSSDVVGSYQRSVYFIDPIVRNLKNKFFKKMIEAGVEADDIHVIGHSLGGQIMGELGRQLNEEEIVLGKCSGIDPAGPCFYASSNKSKLSSGDCKFVEQIHCNAGQRGTNNEDAHFNLYANCAGKMQPNCYELTTLFYPPTIVLQSLAFTTGITSSCSHMYCLELYEDTINPAVIYKAKQCSSYADFRDNKCISSEDLLVGFYSDQSASYNGSYYFKTVDGDCDID